MTEEELRAALAALRRPEPLEALRERLRAAVEAEKRATQQGMSVRTRTWHVERPSRLPETLAESSESGNRHRTFRLVQQDPTGDKVFTFEER